MTEFKSFFKTVGGNEGNKCHYPTRLDTYGCGCQHDCKYCYAKSLLDFRKMWNASQPSIVNIQKVHRVITRHLKEGDIVADDEYLKLMRKDLAHIQVSITCTDDGFCKFYEKATPPTKRIEAIERLQAEGFDVQVRLSPYVPQFIEQGVLDMDIINNIRCDKILVEFLRVNTWIRKWFKIDYSDYTLKQSGYLHLPLESKIKYLKLIQNFKELTVCEDVSKHYDYWVKNVNPNKLDCCNLKR